MWSGWVRATAAATAALALAGCGQIFGTPEDVPEAPGAEAAAPSPAEARAFLEKNARAEGVVALPSGLQYKVVRSGPAAGPRPAMGDEVKVHYEGALTNGVVFDSSYQSGQPAVFTVGQLVKGFDEALMLMRPGDVWYIYMPPELGYGDRAAGPIPPGSVLVFKLEMIGVLPRGGAEAMG